jgi:DNA-binding transcriptional MerR regulator
VRRYSASEFAKLLGRSPSTLKRWERQGKLKAGRYTSGQRYYTDEHLYQALGLSNTEK